MKEQLAGGGKGERKGEWGPGLSLERRQRQSKSSAGARGDRGELLLILQISERYPSTQEGDRARAGQGING